MSIQNPTPKERNHQEMRTRIREIAMRQISEQGAAGLSMSGIAREMGVTQPALFRYVSNRDVLITDLVISAYEDFIAAMQVDLSLPPAEIGRKQGLSLRKWALAQPNQYQLIFGTPIPGYSAPKDQLSEVDAKLREVLMAPLMGITNGKSISDAEARLDAWAQSAGIGEQSGWKVLHALIGWTRLHGVLSLELAGHFTENLPDVELIYEAELDALTENLERHLRG